MESLFMEVESAMNLRRSSFSSTLTNNHSNLYWGLGFKSSQNANNYSLHPSASNTMARASFGGGYLPAATPPTSLYSSLPPFPLHHQPPLLPLPMKSATMPSSTKKINVPPSAINRSSSAAGRQNKQKRKKKQQSRPSTNLKKEPATETSKIEEAPKPTVINKPTILAAKKEEEEEEEEGEETEEEFLIGSPAASKSVPSVYSLSPPPSSLPLPRLLLMRPRRSAKVAAVASSCIAEAMAGVDAGATDDLRKLLRL